MKGVQECFEWSWLQADFQIFDLFESMSVISNMEVEYNRHNVCNAFSSESKQNEYGRWIDIQSNFSDKNLLTQIHLQESS